MHLTLLQKVWNQHRGTNEIWKVKWSEPGRTGTWRHPSGAWGQLDRKPNLTSEVFSYQSYPIPPQPFLFILCLSSLNQISLICIQKSPRWYMHSCWKDFPSLCSQDLHPDTLGFGEGPERVYLALLRSSSLKRRHDKFSLDLKIWSYRFHSALLLLYPIGFSWAE